MSTLTSNVELDDIPVISFRSFLLLLLAAAAGAFAAILLLPRWLPFLSTSLEGNAPHVFWFLSRSSAAVAFGLLWFSMAFGLLITNKLARLWPGGPVAFDLHQFTSLLGLAFALFHALILLGDQYIKYKLKIVLVPFASASYRPIWVGLGQLAFYMMALVALSFYLRRWLGRKAWRLIHYLSFANFSLALLHGIFSGTDSGTVWMRSLYWGLGSVLLFLFIYRLFSGRVKTRPAPARQAAS